MFIVSYNSNLCFFQPFFVERVFQIFDKDESGSISFQGGNPGINIYWEMFSCSMKEKKISTFLKINDYLSILGQKSRSSWMQCISSLDKLRTIKSNFSSRFMILMVRFIFVFWTFDKRSCTMITNSCSNPYFFATWCRTPLIFQTLTIWPKISNSLKYQRSTT